MAIVLGAQAAPPLSPSAANDQLARPGAVKLPPSDPYIDTYQNPDGTFTSLVSMKPIRKRTDNGWEDLTGTLSNSDTPGYAAQADGQLTTRLGATARSANTVTYHGRSLSFAFASVSLLPNQALAASTAPGLLGTDSQSVVLPQVFPGTDATLTAKPEGGLKETIRLNSLNAIPWNGEFTYSLHLDGLDATPVTDASGSTILLSEHGTGNASPVMRIAPPFMIDANGVRSDNCHYLLSDDRTSLTLVVDTNWLNDTERAYPVMVDPTVDHTPDANEGMDTYVDSSNPNTNYATDGSLRVGADGTANLGSSYLRFNLNGLPKGMTSISATLKLHVLSGSTAVYIGNMYGPWDESTLTYNNSITAPTSYAFDVVNSNAAVSPDPLTGNVALDVSTGASHWLAGTARNCGLILVRKPGLSSGGDTFASSDNTTASYRPTLSVTYLTSTPQFNAADCGVPRPWQGSHSLDGEQIVNLKTGNVLTTIPITGWDGFGLGINFSLYHNSRQDTNLSFGLSTKWSHSYASKIVSSANIANAPSTHANVSWIGGDGSLDAYTYVSDNGTTATYTSPPGVHNVLTYVDGTSHFQLTLPSQTVMEYDSTGKLLSLTDELGSVVTLDYADPAYTGTGSRLYRVLDANPVSGNRRSLTFGYATSTSTQITSVTDPLGSLGRVWTLHYNSNNHLDAVKLPRRTDGTTDSLEYQYVFGYYSDNTSERAAILSLGEPNDNPTSGSAVYNYAIDYDNSFRGLSCLGRSGLSYRGKHGIYVQYGPNTNETVVMDQMGVTRSYWYDGVHAPYPMTGVYLVTNPQAYPWNYDFTNSPVTTYKWDTANGAVDLINVRLPGNPTTFGGLDFWTQSFTYNSDGDVLNETTKVLNAAQTSLDHTRFKDYTYANGHHRPTQSRVRTQDTPLMVYQVTDYTYDTSGWKKLMKTETYADNDTTHKRTVQMTYYPDTTYPGRLYQKTDPRLNVWTYEYDGYGNQTKVTSPGTTPRITQWSYASTGNPGLLPVTKTDNKGQVFTTNYHTTGTNPDWRVVYESVSGAGSKLARWDANGQNIYAYNGMSGSIAANETSWTDGGLIVEETQPQVSSTNAAINYRYDAMGRRTQEGFGTTMTTDLTNVYDTLGHLVSQTWAGGFGSSSKTVTYTYNTTGCGCSAGQLVEEDDPNGAKITFEYDGLNEETSRKIWEAPPSARYVLLETSYQLDGQVDTLKRSSSYDSTKTWTKTLSYDAWGEMTAEDVANSVWPHDKQTYQYDANGNRTHWDSSYYNGSIWTTVAFDTYTYDPDNRMSTAYYYDNSVGGPYIDSESFTGAYDGNGNQTRPSGSAQGGASSYTLNYYADNRLSSITGPSSYQETSSYDGMERLQARWAPDGSETEYTYDGSTERRSYTTTSAGYGISATETVPFAASQINASQTYGVGGTTAIQYTYFDQEGTAQIVMDTSGVIQGYCGSDLYGTYCAPAAEKNWLGSEGYRYRPDAGVYQVGARVYDPTLGRFMQQDPIGDGNGDYTYADNNPANEVDPTGLASRQSNGYERPSLKETLSEIWTELRNINNKPYQQCKKNAAGARDRRLAYSVDDYFDCLKKGGRQFICEKEMRQRAAEIQKTYERDLWECRKKYTD